MVQYARTRNAVICLDHTVMIAKGGLAFSAQNANATYTSDMEIRDIQRAKNKFHSCLIYGMQAKLEPYNGSGKKVVVYNTYADKGRLHFDVFIPTDKNQSGQVPKEIDAEAVEYAKEFLSLIGKPSEDVAVNMCERCHIDNTDLYASELWKLPGKEIFIWPMEGCPKPS